MTGKPRGRTVRQVSIHLDEASRALIEQKAAELGVSRSTVVRLAVRGFGGITVRTPERNPAPEALTNLETEHGEGAR